MQRYTVSGLSQLCARTLSRPAQSRLCTAVLHHIHGSAAAPPRCSPSLPKRSLSSRGSYPEIFSQPRPARGARGGKLEKTETVLAPLKDFPESANCTLPVQWGDMDAFGHLGTGTIFRYFESGRFQYYNAMLHSSDDIGHGEVDPKEIREDVQQWIAGKGVGPIIRHINTAFKARLNFPDTVVVGTRVISLEDDRITMQQIVVSQSQKRVVAEAKLELVPFNYKSSARVKIPETIFSAIKALERKRDFAAHELEETSL